MRDPDTNKAGIQLFLYNNGGFADLLLSRLLYRKILQAGRFTVQIGVCHNYAELYRDLEELGAVLRVSDYRCLEEGSPIDLSYLCPPGFLPVSVWKRDYEDTDAFQYEFLLEVFRRRMEEHGIDFDLPYDKKDIPLLDFAKVPMSQQVSAQVAELLAPRPGEGESPKVYLELRRTRDPRCRFFFDLERLAQLFPDLRFFCTLPPPPGLPNFVDVSGLGPLQLARLSEGCDFLLGRSFDPFVLTWTEPNRFKPKALCGYDARKLPRFFSYPGDPAEYVPNMDALVDLLQSVFPRCLRGEEVLQP